MTKIEFLQTLKHFFTGTKEILCSNPRRLPTGYTFADLKNDALKYGYNYSFDQNKNLIIKLTDKQLTEIKLMP